MASGGKKKTTMAKLARENRLRERRQIKKDRKDARRNAPDLPQPELEPGAPLGPEAEDPRAVSQDAELAPAATDRD